MKQVAGCPNSPGTRITVVAIVAGAIADIRRGPFSPKRRLIFAFDAIAIRERAYDTNRYGVGYLGIVTESNPGSSSDAHTHRSTLRCRIDFPLPMSHRDRLTSSLTHPSSRTAGHARTRSAPMRKIEQISIGTADRERLERLVQDQDAGKVVWRARDPVAG